MDDGAALLFLFVWFLFAAGIGIAPTHRGRSGFLFGVLSFFFSPILALIVLALMPNLALQEKQDAQRREDSARDHQRELAAIKAVARPTASPSMADEIEKLAGLKERGVLTQAEFDDQKSRLLRGA